MSVFRSALSGCVISFCMAASVFSCSGVKDVDNSTASVMCFLMAASHSSRSDWL